MRFDPRSDLELLNLGDVPAPLCEQLHHSRVGLERARCDVEVPVEGGHEGGGPRDTRASALEHRHREASGVGDDRHRRLVVTLRLLCPGRGGKTEREQKKKDGTHAGVPRVDGARVTGAPGRSVRAESTLARSRAAGSGALYKGIRRRWPWPATGQAAEEGHHGRDHRSEPRTRPGRTQPLRDRGLHTGRSGLRDADTGPGTDCAPYGHAGGADAHRRPGRSDGRVRRAVLVLLRPGVLLRRLTPRQPAGDGMLGDVAFVGWTHTLQPEPQTASFTSTTW